MTNDVSTVPNEVLEQPVKPSAALDGEDRFAARLRGFGPIGILTMLVILLVGNYPVAPAAGILVLIWVRLSHTPWNQIGYVRPRSWMVTIVTGVAIGCSLKLVMKAIVMPLLVADPINHAFHYLAGNRAALPGILYGLIVGAGFGEETVFRGYLFERLGKLLGRGVQGRIVTVLITSVVFALAHYSLQGLAGVEQATITGLVFGTIFAVTGRIWMLMVAHAAYDLTALAFIYWNVESEVAHWVFR